MGNLWLKIKVWTKISIIVLVAIYVLLFLIFNAGQQVHIWYFFSHSMETTLLQLIPELLLAGVLATFLVRLGWRTMHQLHELQTRQKTSELHKTVAELKSQPATVSVPPPKPAPIPLEKPPTTPPPAATK